MHRVAIFLALGSALVAAPAPRDGVDAAGLALLERAHAGSAAAAREAREHFERLLEADPRDALALARRGLARVLEARDAPLARRQALAAGGFADLDAAVAAAPHDPEVRLVRAVNAAQMPLLLGRRDLAAGDFNRLLGLARDEAHPLEAGLRRTILFQAGAFALKERRLEALALLEEALAVDAAEPAGEAVQSMLALARGALTPALHDLGEAIEDPPAPP